MPELGAGRELDLAIAVQILGWRWIDRGGRAPVLTDPELLALYVPEYVESHTVIHDGDAPDRLPRYSKHIEAAWEVVRALDQRGKAFSIERRRRDSLSENVPATWLANFWAPLGVGESESAPHAICLAALKAVGA